MKRAILVNIPLTETQYPSSSLAAIIPVFKKNNVEVTLCDLNLQLSKAVDDTRLEEIYRWCELTQTISQDTDKFIDQWLQEKVNEWIDVCPNYIAVSVFSFYSILFAQKLFKVVKSTLPNTVVIVGGSGVSSNLMKITNNKTFGEHILENNWARHVVFGEGEVALDHLLQEKPYPGIDQNNPVQVDDLDQLLPPDYSYFEFGQYSSNRLLITGSRGCVRQCTFCDIDVTWPQFKYRSAQSQVNEIIEHSKKYNVKRFEFTDSLINGSVTNWIKFNELLANAKEKDPELADITYSGQFICRDQKSQPAIMYELMHYAGASQITVGIESFSNKIRIAMKKKFGNEAIDYHLEQCARWAIPNIFLMIVGYPDETQQDHQCNIDALYRYKKFSDMGTIFMMRWGTTMHIIKDTPLFNQGNYDILGINEASESLYDWINLSNPQLTLKERIRRRLELHCISHRLGYSQPNSRSELTTMLKLLENTESVARKKVFQLEKNSI